MPEAFQLRHRKWAALFFYETKSPGWDSIPGLGRSPGEGNGKNPLWYSCLGNPVDRQAWRATVHVVSKSQGIIDHTRMHQSTGCKRKRKNFQFLKSEEPLRL